MLVASHEYGEQAVAAVLPHIIGTIHTASGRGTLRRTGGIAVQVMVGDPVCQDDVIETAADGQIGIRFIDGTLFVLSHSTCMVLNEFVCDANSVLRSALFAVSKGGFAFITGRMASNGSLRVDTPVGSVCVCGRARAGGFGTLSLTALTFAMMSDAIAADPNATFLDEDNIAYKDLEHGTYELWTKDPIPRHIIVEDPGETVVVTKIGSSTSVSQITNSAARMEELQAAQQAVFANFAKGYAPGGSSTPYFANPQLLQPINYTQPGGSTTQESLPPPPMAPNPVIEPIIVNPPPPPPTPPTLNAATGPTLNDTVVFDSFGPTAGTLVASSGSSGGALTYGISGGTAGNTELNGLTYDVSKAGLYGTLYLNSKTGAYVYVPDDDAVNALTAPTTEVFTITVSDGTLSASQTFTATINGVNDAAIIGGSASGAVIEAGAVANAAAGAPSATGTLTDTDVDNAANTFTAVSSPTASDKGYGSFTMTAAGTWTYTLNNSNQAVQALNAGGTLTDTFTVTTIDGTPQVVTITITGSNDAAVISGTTTGSVIEAGVAASGTPVATGTLTDSDVDNAANTFTAISSPTTSDKGYGSFTMTAAGVWVYTLDNSNQAVQALNAGQTLTDTFTVTTVDGTTQVVTITITGSNDNAVISGTTSGSVIEAGGVANAVPGTPSATGTLTASDVDNAANAFTAVSSPTASDKGYGSFTMTAAGTWTYTLNNSNQAVQGLNAGQTLTDTFTVTTVDGTTQVVTITITGTNDAAVISGTTTGSVIEAGVASPGTPIATGTLTDTDVDNAANTFTAVTSPTNSDKGYGSFTMTAAGVWTYTLDNSNQAVQGLNAGQTLTDTFTVTAVDGTTQVVTITITGSNDNAVISGTTTGSVVEAGGVANAVPGTPSATGTLTASDVDNAANAFTAVSSPTASDKGYGTFMMTAAGVWVYTLNNSNQTVQGLNAGNTLTDTFTVTTVDGTTQVVTITITGSNDAAVISGTSTGAVTEAGGVANAVPGTPTATGTLSDSDVDNAANTFTVVSTPTQSDKHYGSFTMTAAGVWTYTLDNANQSVQALNAGGTLTDTFTVTTVDGTPQVVTITITGSNDAAVVSGTTTGAVTEAGGVANALPGTPSATGTLTDSDVDNTANAFTTVSTPTASDKGYGTFTMTAAGVWVYTLDNANQTVQGLNVGQTLTDTFTVTTVDGTTQVVTITITGRNDAAVISGTTTGSVIEAGTTVPGTPVATGTLTDADVDNADNTFIAVSSATKSDKGYGSFTMTAAGVWIYTLDNSNQAVEALNPGQTLTDTFTVTTVDGTTQVVTITIQGSSDADPNDFDNLAPGPGVVVDDTTDPPSVFGTPNGDSIAGGGDIPQQVYTGAGEDTVNGTGVDDILYSGSGNDTIKGNGGNDTIYGGSGIDDIDGSNGNDTIIGGFGGDKLRGGNGSDTFEYLYVADSNRTQFDIIADFQSGTDRIKLTAFGPLTFMEDELTGTSVPPHSIAWISVNNETIVYVNQTDQILEIGNSALLEIHLQGVASVAESDFVYEPATTSTVVAAADTIDPALAAIAAGDTIVLTASIAEVSPDSTVSASEQVTSAFWTEPADEGFSFHFASDKSDLVGATRLARFEAPEHATEDSDGDAVVVLASVSSAEVQHGQATVVTEDHFAFEQGSTHTSAGAKASGAAETSSVGTIDHAGVNVANAAAATQVAEDGVTPGSGNNPSQSQYDLHTAKDNASAHAHLEENPVDAGQGHPAHDPTPGNGANHGQSQKLQTVFDDVSTTTQSESTTIAAGPGHSAHDDKPDNGANHGQSQKLQTVSDDVSTTTQSESTTIAAGPGHPAHDDKPDNAANHGQSQKLQTVSDDVSTTAQSESSTVAGGPNPPLPANASQAAANAPELGDSFHFNNEVVDSAQPGAVEVADVGNGAASVDHGGHGGGNGAHGSAPDDPSAILETAALSPADQHAVDHTHVAQQHAAIHGHDLMV